MVAVKISIVLASVVPTSAMELIQIWTVIFSSAGGDFGSPISTAEK